ncbi:aldehyde dehydrogenase family protein [Ideonella sp.]|uniref:aldehyde dehydrogenase family protein n=1 Tax=Ideonella sp. TaxID=1929293 RepID=UPI002B492378|nr:aldehyde dehydrogenase family protein [Ideonella sp.]HJV69635.1 aldehyde dehydrogenase family protein [Ideonella sp.]
MPTTEETARDTIQQLFERQGPTALALRQSKAGERVRKLERLRDALLSRRETLYTAFEADLRKPRVEVDLTEFLPVVDEARHAIARLSRWMRPKRVGATLTTLGTSAKVLHQPRGRCLVIGPWNYPVNTLLGPLVSAIAAGNTVILKPSEMTPQVNAVVAELVAEVFDATEVALVQGGVQTAQHLLALPFDHIFFTGSPAVGKIVMAAAAQHLTSVTLELGGKSPTIVDESADLAQAAQLIMWGKLTNAGQTCVAPDHVFVHRSVSERFVQLCREAIAARYGQTPDAIAGSPDLARMITPRHAQRVGALVDEAVARGARVAAGGEHTTEARYVAPTLLTDVPAEAAISHEEIFGPVLPIEAYDDLDEVIRRVNAAPKPLALYVWSRDRRVAERVIEQTSSGGVCLNLCVQQYAHAGLPFGGVNNSGIGNAHGVFGFKAFSHERAFLAAGPVTLLKWFFPPYTKLSARLSRLLVQSLKWI